MSAIMPLDSVSSLVAFVAAVESGGFAPAGRKLGLSASAVGKSVSRLEQRLGVKLLHRSTRSIAVTSEGELLYVRSAQILDEIREAESAISLTRARPRGRLTVSIPTVLGRRVIIPALRSFVDKYPDVELSVHLSDRRVDIVEEGYDLVVRLGKLDDSRLVARRIAPHRFSTCAAPDYLSTYGSPRSPDELVRYSCIRYRSPNSGRLEDWEFIGETKPQVLGPGLVVNDGEALAIATLGGMGISQVPTYLVSGDIAAGRLQEVLAEYTSDRGHIWLVRPPSRPEVPRVRVFAEFTTALLGSNSI